MDTGVSFVPNRPFLVESSHIFMFNLTPSHCSSRNMVPPSSMCSSAVLDRKMMSSKYTKVNCHLDNDNMTSKVRCKVAGALQGRKDMQEIPYDSWCKMYAVLCGSSSSILTYKSCNQHWRWRNYLPIRVNRYTVHSGFGVEAAFCYGLQILVVHTESGWSIFLRCSHDWNGPFRLDPFNPLDVLHIFNFKCFKFLHFWPAGYGSQYQDISCPGVDAIRIFGILNHLNWLSHTVRSSSIVSKISCYIRRSYRQSLFLSRIARVSLFIPLPFFDFVWFAFIDPLILYSRPRFLLFNRRVQFFMGHRLWRFGVHCNLPFFRKWYRGFWENGYQSPTSCISSNFMYFSWLKRSVCWFSSQCFFSGHESIAKSPCNYRRLRLHFDCYLFRDYNRRMTVCCKTTRLCNNTLDVLSRSSFLPIIGIVEGCICPFLSVENIPLAPRSIHMLPK